MAEPSPPDAIPGEAARLRPDRRSEQLLRLRAGRGSAPCTRQPTAHGGSTPTRPAWMQEGTYEYENNWGHFSAEPWDTRRGRFWSVLAGGTAGDGFGSKDVWQWQNIPESLSSPGARYSTYAFDLFGSLPWWELEPSGTDPGHTGVELIPSGNGPWGQLIYITSARTSRHDWLLAYVPVTEEGERIVLGRHVRAGGPGARSVVRSDDRELHRHQRRLRIREQRRAEASPRPGAAATAPTTGCSSWTPPRNRDAAPSHRLDATPPPRSSRQATTCEITASPRTDPSVIARVRVTVRGGA